VAEQPDSSFERAAVDLLLGVAQMRPDDVGPAIIAAATTLGAWDAEVLLVDVDQRRLRTFAPVTAAVQDIPVDGTPPGLCYREQRIVEVGEVDRGLRLLVPIVDSAERVGVLCVSVRADLATDRLEALASLAGEVLVTKSAYGDSIVRTKRSQAMTLAAELRWAMLPPLTFSSPRIDVSGILQPAYDIAGDTFDYAVNGDVVHFGVFDAIGHGLEASQIANLAVASYRNSRRHDFDLAEILVEMDDVVSRAFGRERFVTAQLGTIHLPTGELRLVNAGHPPPLLLRGDRDAGDVSCGPGRPVGLGAVPSGETVLALEPGDVVVLHTDGVTEARDESGAFYGRQRLVSTIEASLAARHPRAETLRIITQELSEFQAGIFHDDASLILLSWWPPPP
jgi:serine/threonine protein phosphatase PrpC